MVETIIIVFCLLCSAFFSASETAYSALNRNRLRLMAEKGSRRAALAVKLSDDYDSLISGILVGNNLVNIALASAGTVLFVRWLGTGAGPSVSTAAVTLIVLIFGEITPKSIAKDHPEKFAVFAAPMLRALCVILKPVNFLFSKWKKLIGKLFGGRDNKNVTQEELLLMLEEVEKEGAIDRSEGELLVKAVEFADSTVGEILTHRTDMEAVGSDWEPERIAAVFTESGLSRLPVYEGDLDHIVGVLNRKDFFTSEGISKTPVNELRKPPVFAESGEKLGEVLKLMKKQQTHLCIVVDEYGGTSGLVTMEDILEELVGEIWDEHDEVTEEIKTESDSVWTANGLTKLEDFAERFGLEISSENVSLGGWIMEMLGRVPEAGDSFEYGDYLIRVTETDGHRAAECRIERIR
ncbi:MAG: HlyC/CorC family transporter [Clostridia bacterium]|nr:HlyC/CorC family transporter [Clostridia bacterium]